MSEIEALKSRRAKLLANGKNSEGTGVIRKIDRKIRNLEKVSK